MITPVSVSTVGPLTKDVEALGEAVFDALDTLWGLSIPRLVFAAWLKGHAATDAALGRRDWTRIYQLYKLQEIKVANNTVKAYRFVSLVMPADLATTPPEDRTPAQEYRLTHETDAHICFLGINAEGKITSLVNPVFNR